MPPVNECPRLNVECACVIVCYITRRNVVVSRHCWFDVFVHFNKFIRWMTYACFILSPVTKVSFTSVNKRTMYSQLSIYIYLQKVNVLYKQPMPYKSRNYQSNHPLYAGSE